MFGVTFGEGWSFFDALLLLECARDTDTRRISPGLMLFLSCLFPEPHYRWPDVCEFLVPWTLPAHFLAFHFLLAHDSSHDSSSFRWAFELPQKKMFEKRAKNHNKLSKRLMGGQKNEVAYRLSSVAQRRYPCKTTT